MRDHSESLKQSLRLVSAARYYLPVHLESPPEWEAQYVEYLHHTEYQLALEAIEGIGDLHSGYAEEPLFWQELLLASQHMGLGDHAALYSSKLVSAQRGQQV
jgi:hypothetical protein